MLFSRTSAITLTSFVICSLAGAASAAAIDASSDIALSNIEERQAGTTGYHYMACLGTQFSPFNTTVARHEFGDGAAVNPACSSFCRGHSTQYYAVIDYLGKCFCGNDLILTLDEYYSNGCLPCGDTTAPDEHFATGPGMCGDYYIGGVAVYCLDF